MAFLNEVIVQRLLSIFGQWALKGPIAPYPKRNHQIGKTIN